MTEEIINNMVEGYYRLLERCLSTRWSSIISRFPPNALRQAIRRVVEAFVNADMDPATFDWCTYFGEIEDYETVDQFIESLVKRNLIPRDRLAELDQVLAWLERQATELGYRLVKEEEYYRLTKDVNRLRRELEKLKRERERLDAEVKRLTEYISTFERRAAVPKPPPTPPVIARKRLSEVMDYNQFLSTIASILDRYGIPQPLFNKVIPLIEGDLRTWHVQAHEGEIADVASRIFNWVVNEYLKARCQLINPSQAGAVVRSTRPIWVDKRLVPPKISYVEPRFELWLKDLASIGYRVVRDMVPVLPGITNVVHDPDAQTEKVFAFVCDGALSAINCDAIVYAVVEQTKVVYYYRYKPLKVVTV